MRHLPACSVTRPDPCQRACSAISTRKLRSGSAELGVLPGGESRLPPGRKRSLRGGSGLRPASLLSQCSPFLSNWPFPVARACTVCVSQISSCPLCLLLFTHPAVLHYDPTMAEGSACTHCVRRQGLTPGLPGKFPAPALLHSS